MPLISVIIPVYNGQETILRTIESIRCQSFQDFEIIVINDGSTDATLDRISTIRDARIKVFSYENGGLPVARNRGIKRAIGDLLSFIDADDVWTSDKLELQLRALQNRPEAGVAYSWTSFIDENDQFLFARAPEYHQGNVYPTMLVRNFISSGSNIMVRREIVEQAGEFDPNLRSVEDWDYYIRLAALCPFVYVPKYQILYRRSSNSMTAKVDVMEAANLTVIERAFQAAPPEYQRLKKKSLANAYRYLAKQCLGYQISSEDIRKSIEKLSASIHFDPSIMMQRETQRIMLKVLMLSLFPRRLSTHVLRLIAQYFPMVNVAESSVGERVKSTAETRS